MKLDQTQGEDHGEQENQSKKKRVIPAQKQQPQARK